MSLKEFKLVRSNRFQLSRKIKKFEVWDVNDMHRTSLTERIKSENVENSINDLSDSVDWMPNSGNDLGEYIRSFTEY